MPAIRYDTKVMLQFISRHPRLLPILAALLFQAKAGLFFQQNPSFTLFWDWPGHLQKAQVASLPWQGGWDTTFWGGYSTMVYPNLFHLLLKWTLGVSHSEISGVMVLSSLILLLEVHAAWRLVTRSVAKNRPFARSAAFLATLAVVALGDRTLMGSFLGTLFTGGGPGGLATAWLLYFFSSTSWPSGAFFLGLLFLTHPLSALVAFLYAACSLIQSLVFRQWRELKIQLLGLLVGTTIGLPWILPQLDPSLATTAINLPGSTSLLPWILMAILVISALEHRRLGPLWWTAMLTGVLSITPDTWAAVPELIDIRGLHFFRFQWFEMLLTPTVLAGNSWFRLKNRTASLILVFLALGIIAGGVPKQQANLEVSLETVKTLKGRVLDASRHAWFYAYTNAMEHQLAANTPLVGSTRWIWEAGSRGLLYFSLKNAVDPQSFKDGTYLRTFNDALGKPRLPLGLAETAALLGVNYVSFTSTAQPEASRQDIWEIGSIRLAENKNKDESVVYHYYLEKISDSPLITPLSQLPAVDPDFDLGEWWLNSDRSKLFSREELPPGLTLDYSAPQLTLEAIEPTRIAFSVNSQAWTPVLIKFAYSPYWQARPTTSESETTQPIWVVPGHLLLAAHGAVELVWRTPLYQKVFSLVSALALLALTVVLGLRQLSQRLQHEKRSGRHRLN